MDQEIRRPGFCSSERSGEVARWKSWQAEPRRCSEREPADSLGDKSNAIGGWLPSLTFGDVRPVALDRRIMNQHSVTTGSPVTRAPVFFWITVSLLAMLLLAGVAAVLFLVLEAGRINREGGWGWILVAGISVM